MFAQHPERIATMPVADLVNAWVTGFPVELGQCESKWLNCGPDRPTKFHDPSCMYLAVDWQTAGAFASAILANPPLNSNGQIDPQAVLNAANKQIGNGTATAVGATSILTDSIALPPGGYFDNGRHRVAALADQGVAEVVVIPGHL